MLSQDDASPVQLERAAAVNHTSLFRQEAEALGGSYVTRGELSWTSGTPYSPSMVPFPELGPQQAGSRLDELIDFYLKHPPKGAGCWSLDPTRPADLGALLLARGFQPGWRPRWMGLDLLRVQTHHPFPKGLDIDIDNLISLDSIKGLPYAQVVIPSAQKAELPGQWTRFIARWKGKIVAHSIVFLSTGPYGAAGIYHVGVVPRARRLGIGKAVTLAACLHARDKGYRYAVLNSTDAGRRTYERLGFVTVGEGHTWWLLTERLLAHPPSPREVRLAEAVARGDRETLDQLRHEPADLNRPITNGMTLMELAVHCRRPEAAEWLVTGGAACSILDAWDLDWKDRARQLVADDPSLVDRLYGEWNKTLLHFAAERNDEELARLALSADADLQLKDKVYQSTALGWAQHFGHHTIAELIETHRR
ncbi:MAG TPA: GNAT family N-acetyltransferase [Puia sp.]|uniref:GNAT family N-acetyltransferase n=1 Tax=Puia sp. TaxID=2045100 RepID=UPI002BFDA810|nr:GNAT family N-acetyltransferase [Puia sp.]HVU96559.1 GNAT family N-acetyltransferase [Puia sp.]